MIRATKPVTPQVDSDRAAKRTNTVLMFVLIALSSIITVAVLLQRPLSLDLILGTSGFALFTFAWTGMYFRLKRELPEHTLVTATYLNLPGVFLSERRVGLRNMLRLIQLHVERHHLDPWSALLVAGLAMLAASLVRYAA